MPKKLASIFIVEDNPLERTMLTDHLAKYPNVTVKGFYSGDACVKEIVTGKSEDPDLILMDYFLDTSIASGSDGLETLRKLKEICPNTEIVMFTSVSKDRIVELAKQRGALDYVVKGPESFTKLDEVLKKHFEIAG